ncbi:MAG: hypothetical protein IH951_16035, partial [Bacteroidetes bacterium]|nr:hypothetical protein [Bacteroidota bacterium]
MHHRFRTYHRIRAWPSQTRALLIALMFIALPFGKALAQGTIAGTVHDEETTESLIGVNVIVVGTSLGSATDLDG